MNTLTLASAKAYASRILNSHFSGIVELDPNEFELGWVDSETVNVFFEVRGDSYCMDVWTADPLTLRGEWSRV